MEIKIFYESDNALFSDEITGLINGLIRQHSKSALEVLPFNQKFLTFTIFPWTKNEISAFAQARDMIKVSLNLEELIIGHRNFEETIEQFIYIIYHEMHHACREYVGNLPDGEEHILIGSMISEGLADDFAIMMHPSKHVLEKNSYNFEEIDPWIKKLKQVMWNKEIDDDSWLYGGGDKPKMLGYQIGRYVIKKLRENNPDLDSVKLVKTEARKILELSGVNFS